MIHNAIPPKVDKESEAVVRVVSEAEDRQKPS